jgi:hypothetical protein
MRTVICLLTGCAQAEVTRALDAHFVAQGGDAPWLLLSDGGDAVLYIELYPQIVRELEAIDAGLIEKVRASLGGEIEVSVAADVSGRHDGGPKATEFALALLSRFRGVAMDDFSEHLWTRSEIEQRAIVDGRRFFEHLPVRAPEG